MPDRVYDPQYQEEEPMTPTTAAEYLAHAGLELARALDIPYTMREQLVLTAFLDAYARQRVEAFRERVVQVAQRFALDPKSERSVANRIVAAVRALEP